MDKIKLNFVFETYPLFYQPYIELLVENLLVNPEIELQFTSFKPKVIPNTNTRYIPKYRTRRIIERLWHWFKPEYKLLTYPEILWLREKMDIIHIQHSFLHTHVLNLLKLPKDNRPKIVITLRGADTYLKPYTIPRWKEFYREYGYKVDAFITVSEHQKLYLTKWEVPIEKIHVVPISFGSKSKALPKTISDKTLRIISAFRMTWEKNIGANIQTIKLLVEKGYNLKYDIYGDGNDLSQVYYLIDRYKLNDFIECHGKISNKEFKKILPSYDFYLQLSVSESAGATIIEAQSNGVPCIVSDSDGLPEMIINNKTGFAVPYYDFSQAANRMVDLMSNKSKYYKFSEAAIEFVNSKFSVNAEAKLLEELYKKLLQ